MLVRSRNLPQVSASLEATLCWMSEEPLGLSTPYILQHTARQVRAHVWELTYRVDIDTLHREPAETLALNEIGRANLTTTQPIFFDRYQANRATGNFILIDPYTNNTVAAGMIRRAARSLAEVLPPEPERPKSSNVVWEGTAISRELREERHGHKAAVLWFTGLSGSGKSTVARLLERRLYALGCQTFYLDGDTMRHGLNGDLGFSPADRKENIRRVAEVASWLRARQRGTVHLHLALRRGPPLRALLVPPDRFFEVYAKCDLEVVKRCDPKGLYARAAGRDQRIHRHLLPYEAPEDAELVIETDLISAEGAVEMILADLAQRSIIKR